MGRRACQPRCSRHWHTRETGAPPTGASTGTVTCMARNPTAEREPTSHGDYCLPLSSPGEQGQTLGGHLARGHPCPLSLRPHQVASAQHPAINSSAVDLHLLNCSDAPDQQNHLSTAGSGGVGNGDSGSYPRLLRQQQQPGTLSPSAPEEAAASATASPQLPASLQATGGTEAPLASPPLGTLLPPSEHSGGTATRRGCHPRTAPLHYCILCVVVCGPPLCLLFHVASPQSLSPPLHPCVTCACAALPMHLQTSSWQQQAARYAAPMAPCAPLRSNALMIFCAAP